MKLSKMSAKFRKIISLRFFSVPSIKMSNPKNTWKVEAIKSTKPLKRLGSFGLKSSLGLSSPGNCLSPKTMSLNRKKLFTTSLLPKIPLFEEIHATAISNSSQNVEPTVNEKSVAEKPKERKSVEPNIAPSSIKPVPVFRSQSDFVIDKSHGRSYNNDGDESPVFAQSSQSQFISIDDSENVLPEDCPTFLTERAVAPKKPSFMGRTDAGLKQAPIHLHSSLSSSKNANENFVKLNMKFKKFIKGSNSSAKVRKWKFSRRRSAYKEMATQKRTEEAKSAVMALEKAESNALVCNLSEPFFANDTSETQVDTFLEEKLNFCGIPSYRPGQMETIRQILKGQSSLLVSPTGSGKSLCFHLSAQCYNERNGSVCVVIPPLISLVADQLKQLPQWIQAVSLDKWDAAKRGEMLQVLSEKGRWPAILFASPELVVATNFFQSDPVFPKISFVCIDEAHCIQSWSHFFRPAYFKLPHLLKTKGLLARTLLLTGSASPQCIDHLVNSFEIPRSNLIRPVQPVFRPNTHLAIISTSDCNAALLELFRREPLRNSEAVIIYCPRRETSTTLAARLRTLMTDHGHRGAKRGFCHVVESYHGGLQADERTRVQNSFLSGQTRIVCATVAFGLGIDHPGVDSVIHFGLPQNLEAYIQEVGRAGRRGQQAYCVALTSDPIQHDANEQLKHVWADWCDLVVLKKVMMMVFPHDTPGCPLVECRQVFRSISIDACTEALDIPSMSLLTLLSLLEKFGLLSLVNVTPKQICMNVVPSVDAESVASLEHSESWSILKECQVDSVPSQDGSDDGVWRLPEQTSASTSTPRSQAFRNIIQQQNGRRDRRKGVLTVSLVKLANRCGFDDFEKARVWLLQRTSHGGDLAASVYGHTDGVVFQTSCCLSHDEWDAGVQKLLKNTQTTHKSRILAIENLVQLFSTHATSQVAHAFLDKNRSDAIKSAAQHFFQPDPEEISSVSNFTLSTSTPQTISLSEVQERDLKKQIRHLLGTHGVDIKFTAKAIARIFYGIQSPNFLAQTWGKTNFWRAGMHADFMKIFDIAREILSNLS